MSSCEWDSPADVTMEDPAPWPVSNRSILAPLAPMGLGTCRRESLTSYFQRLADCHCVQPRLLARELVVPRLGFSNSVNNNQADRFWRSRFFNGIGEVPRKWTRIIEELTSVPGLDRLTLLPLRGKVGLHGVSPAGRKWCPLCLQEHARAGVPYGELLWEIGSVTACPRHEIPLVNSCGCEASSKLPPLKVKFLPNLCHHCGRDLSHVPESPIQRAAPLDVMFAKSVAKLLDSESFERDEIAKAPGSIADFLKAAVEVVGDGNGAQISFILSVSKGALSDWCNHHHVPSLPQAAHVSRAFGVPLAEVLQGMGAEQLEGCRPIPIERIPARGTTMRLLLCIDHLVPRMQSLLEATPPMSVADAEVLLNMSLRELTCFQPELTRAIAQRYKDWQKQESLERRNICLDIIRELAVQMATEGVIPTIKRLEPRMKGVLATSFLFKERVACSRICQEARRLHLSPKSV